MGGLAPSDLVLPAALADAEVLDRRLVLSGPDGWAEWLLVLDAEGEVRWVPVRVDAAGRAVQPAWMPLPGSQVSFLSCPVFEVLYEGTRGPGKSLTLLMDFAQDVGKGYGQAWRGVLFRRHYKDLDDLVRKIEDLFPRIFGPPPAFRFLRNPTTYRAEWATGEALLLRQGVDRSDYDDFHGHEYPWIGFEELTQYENDEFYRLMMSCCRPPAPGVPRRYRATTNPYGAGHNWVKRRFRLPGGRGRVIREPDELPRTAVLGTLSENFVLLQAAPEYRMQVAAAATNAAQKAAWTEADWDVTAGGMLDDIWRSDVHVLPEVPFERVPRSWTVSRAYDHGQSKPFSVGWFLESSGEPFEWRGRTYGRVRGDVILWREWYGTTGQPNDGLGISARRIAEGIRDREVDAGVWGRVVPGPADTEIWNPNRDRGDRSPADDMEEVGVSWDRADKSPGSRRRGWENVRAMLSGAIAAPDGTRDQPGFFVCENCEHWLELGPPVPRGDKDPDEIADGYEDHCLDMVRYRLRWRAPLPWTATF